MCISRRIVMKKSAGILLITIFLTSSIVAAESSVPTTGLIGEDLRLELRTQELILERIIRHYDKNRIIVHHNVVSYYINDFGALFEVQRFPVSEVNIFNQFGLPDNPERTKYIWSEEKNAIVKFEAKHSKKDSVKVVKMVDDYLKDLNLAAFEFFADYISETTRIIENETVLIHFDVNLNNKIPKEFDRDMIEKIVPISIQISAKISDLKNFQKGNLSIDQLNRKIVFKKIMINPQSYSYKILGDIIESAVKSIKSDDDKPFSIYSTSFIVENLGAVYFFVTQYQQDKSISDFGGLFESLFGRRSENKDEKNQYDDLVREYKLRFAKVVFQYGDKLKDIRDDEWIVLMPIIGYHGQIKTRFVMKIQKKYVTEPEINNMTFNEFLNRLQVYDDEVFD